MNVPGQRKPSDSSGPRPPSLARPARAVPLSHDVQFNRGAYDEAHTAALQRGGYDVQPPPVQDCFAPAAWRAAFGDPA